jgi:hypothetical protein
MILIAISPQVTLEGSAKCRVAKIQPEFVPIVRFSGHPASRMSRGLLVEGAFEVHRRLGGPGALGQLPVSQSSEPFEGGCLGLAPPAVS